MGGSPSKPPEPKDFDRSFILFGKANSGKSTLANLLLKSGDFETHKRSGASGLTKDVQQLML